MIRKTAIIGMGALGLLYANQIAQGMGENAVSFIMNKERLQKYQDAAFTINQETVRFQMVDEEEATPADLVIVAVKYGGLASALTSMEKCVGENTIIMSVMNGISSEEIIAQKYGMDRLIYTVAQGMDAMKFGNDLRYTKMGELHLGIIDEKQRPNLDSVVSFFEEIKMPYVQEDDILYRMWAKFMLNVGVNQTCHAYLTTYSGCLAQGTEANAIFVKAMEEVVQIANAEGIALSHKDVEEYIAIIGTLDPNGVPSMRQDGIAGRKSEVEMFAGTVLKLAQKHGIQTPANQLLYDRIYEIESAY